MKKENIKKFNWKKIVICSCFLLLAIFVMAVFYLKLLDEREKAFNITSALDEEYFITLTEGEELIQKFEITIEEPTAVSVKLVEEQENIENIDLVYSIYDQKQFLIQERVYTEYQLNYDGQLYIHFDEPLTKGVYYLSIKIVDHEETNTSLDLLLGNILGDSVCMRNGESTGVSLAIQQSNFLWSYDAYRDMCEIIMVVLFVAILVLAYLIFAKKIPFHWAYFAVAMVLGMIFMFIIPPYSAPDEQTHISTAIEIADQWMGWTDLEDENADFRARWTELDNGYNAYLTRDVYNNYLNRLFDPVPEGQEVVIDAHHEFSTVRALYIVPAIGIVLGRILVLNGTTTLLLARILNLVSFVLMVTYAVKKIPFGKMVIAGVCLLPMTLQQASSYSYDNPVIAAGMVATALGIHWCYSNEKVRKNEIVMYLLVSLILILGKGSIYSVLLFLPFLYKFSREKLQILWSKYKVQTAAYLVFLIVILMWNKITGAINSFFVIEEAAISEAVVESTTETVGNYIAWVGAEGYTVGELLRNPIELIRIFFNTIYINVDWFLGSMLGSSLGWFDISVPWLYLFAGLIVVLLATIKPVNEEEELIFVDKLFAGGMGLVSWALCLLGLLLLWTPKGSASILGVQGRYFLPTLAIILLALRTKNLQIKRNIDRELLYSIFLINLPIILVVLVHGV